jgi:hypothetical protein
MAESRRKSVLSISNVSTLNLRLVQRDVYFKNRPFGRESAVSYAISLVLRETHI